MHASPDVFRIPPTLAVGFLVLVWAVLLVVRLTGPIDLMDKDRDQEKPSAYVVDAVRNGNWITQRDHVDDVTSKPPLYTWLAAGTTVVLGGEISRLSMAIPCALAVLAVVLLMYRWGEAVFGPMAGFWAALAYLLANTTYRQLALFRTDTLFTLTIFATLLLVFWAWEARHGRSWFWVWIAGLATNLTKGPVGILLALFGLGAAVWDRAPGMARARALATAPVWNRWHLAGFVVFAAGSGAWFAGAWAIDGEAFYDRIFVREFAGHITGSEHAGSYGILDFFRPLTYLFTRVLPWSLPGFYGLYRVWKHPSADPYARAFERFLAMHLVLSLVMFGIPTHKRMELYYPLVPALLLLGGREIAQWFPLRRPTRYAVAIAGIVAIAVVAYAAGEHWGRVHKPGNVRAAAIRVLAEDARAVAGPEFPYTHIYTPYTFQFYNNTMRPYPTPRQAWLLLTCPEEVFVTVDAAWPYVQFLAWLARGEPLHELARADEAGSEYARILGSHPRLAPVDGMAFVHHGLLVRYHGAILERADEYALRLAAASESVRVSVENLGTYERLLSITVETERIDFALDPGETGERRIACTPSTSFAPQAIAPAAVQAEAE